MTDERRRIAVSDAFGETLVFVSGERIAFVELRQDDLFDDEQLEECLSGTIGSFRRRDLLFIDPREGDRRVDEARGRYLSWFGHGAERWFPRGSSTPAGVEFVWDGVRTAGVWTPGPLLLADVSDAADAEARLDAACAADCRLFTDWVNGEVYALRIAVFALRRDERGAPLDLPSDYRRDEPLDVTNVGGVFSSADVWETVEEVLSPADEPWRRLS